eukprot:3676495-Amphidinium_carterae.1
MAGFSVVGAMSGWLIQCFWDCSSRPFMSRPRVRKGPVISVRASWDRLCEMRGAVHLQNVISFNASQNRVPLRSVTDEYESGQMEPLQPQL